MEHWMTWDPCDGWTEHATEAEARDLYDTAIQDVREASADGWPEDAERIGLWRLVPVVTVALVQTATSEDDTDEGAMCRAKGWDYIAEAVETEHPDEVAALRAEIVRLTAERDALRVEAARPRPRVEWTARRCGCGCVRPYVIDIGTIGDDDARPLTVEQLRAAGFDVDEVPRG